MGWAAIGTLSALYPQMADQELLRAFFSDFAVLYQRSFKTTAKFPCGWGSRVAWGHLWDRQGDGADAGAPLLVQYAWCA